MTGAAAKPGPSAGERGSGGSSPGAKRRDPHPGRWGVPRWVLAAGKLALTALVTWLILRGAGVQLEEAWRIDWTAVRPDPPLLALSVLLCLPAFVLAAALWSRILEDFGEARMAIAAASAILVVANLGRYLPGKVAQLGGVAVLARREGVSAVRAGAAAVTAQLLNLLAAAIVGAWALARWPGAEGWGGAAAGLGAAVALGIFLGRGGAGRGLRWLLRRRGHTEGLPRTGGRRMLALLPGYVVIWGFYGAGMLWLARGLGMDLRFGAITVSFAASYLAGYLAIVAPAGIGVRESTLVFLLTPHLGPEASVLLAAAQRIWITAIELAAAAAGLLLLARSGRGRAGSESVSGRAPTAAEGIR